LFDKLEEDHFMAQATLVDRRVDRCVAALPPSAWTILEIHAGEKGPLLVEALKRRVSAKTNRRRAGSEEVLVVFRAKQEDGTF
jgi:hypothetical protein